jgi:hypothetical protein
MKTTPIKRNIALRGLSREHHHGLLLCWKIRRGLSIGIEIQRIKRYVDWFYKSHLISYFEVEEEHIFPVLGHENELVKKAVSQHRRLVRLFTATEDIPKSLNLIEEELDQHKFGLLHQPEGSNMDL